MVYETQLLQDRKICIDLSKFTWGLLKDGQFKAAIDDKSCVDLYPLLERSFHEIKAEVSKINNLLEVEEDSFPYELLVSSALNYPTSYWPNLAVNWLEQSNLKSAKIQLCLLDIKNNKDYDQHLRQRIKKFLREKPQSRTLESIGSDSIDYR